MRGLAQRAQRWRKIQWRRGQSESAFGDFVPAHFVFIGAIRDARRPFADGERAFVHAGQAFGTLGLSAQRERQPVQRGIECLQRVVCASLGFQLHEGAALR